MTKEQQEALYKSIGRHLTRARENKNLTISQLASRSDEQFNTVRAIEEGRPFMAHQLYWMREILDINLNILIKDAHIENGISIAAKDDGNGEEEIMESFRGNFGGGPANDYQEGTDEETNTLDSFI